MPHKNMLSVRLLYTDIMHLVVSYKCSSVLENFVCSRTHHYIFGVFPHQIILCVHFSNTQHHKNEIRGTL